MSKFSKKAIFFNKLFLVRFWSIFPRVFTKIPALSHTTFLVSSQLQKKLAQAEDGPKNRRMNRLYFMTSFWRRAKDYYIYSLYCEGIISLYITKHFLTSWNRNDVRLQMVLDITSTQSYDWQKHIPCTPPPPPSVWGGGGRG